MIPFKQKSHYEREAAPFRATGARQAMPMLDKDSLYNYYIAQITQQKILMVTIEQQQAAIRAVQLNEAEVKNNLVNATGLIETNEKIINDININYQIEGREYLLSRYQEIYAIANQCPYAGGPAVYEARVLLRVITDTILYDDASTCLLQGIYRAAAGTDNENAIEIFLKPNPANEYVDLFIANNNGSNCKVTITDALCKEVKAIAIDCKQKSVRIDTRQLAQGVYTVAFIMDGLKLKSQKLVIQR
jgi:nitrite reductase/ring-hydroxylating ferredoxin subunit